jgi:hypothetical protein
MDAAVQTLAHRAADPLRAVPGAQWLNVAAIYQLSEAGRKASLLTGGDGKALQRLTVQVPAPRLHLVSVDQNGSARLKLQPRFERVDGQVVRRDGPPTYDVPPAIDDLFRDAARNHELEREFLSERSRSRDRRRDEDRLRRLEVAEEFLGDAARRAMPHPAPTPKRCFLATPAGRVMFDVATDVGPARDLPPEAFRRFRADLRARKDENLKQRVQQLALHADKTRFAAQWIAEHGSDDQRARQTAGVLPLEEVVDALADEAFAAVNDVERYPLDGSARLEAHLRRVTGRIDINVAPADLQVAGRDATTVTAAQWGVARDLEARLPGATVTVREHRLSWRRDAHLPPFSVYGVLVTRQVGPFVLRREFAAPER